MKVELIDWMGTDISVVNAARVSFAKESEYEIKAGNRKYDQGIMSEKDQKLIKYLATHNHWTPFGHTALSFRIKAPIFVARQLGKHQIGLVWNEVSRRYVDDEPEFYEPMVWRKRAENVKQGSSDDAVDLSPIETMSTDYGCVLFPAEINRDALSSYKALLDIGVCPEQARMVLPQSMYTEWIWTGNVASFARVCRLRLDPHTQKETRDIAEMISGLCQEKFPYSWSALIQ